MDRLVGRRLPQLDVALVGGQEVGVELERIGAEVALLHVPGEQADKFDLSKNLAGGIAKCI